MKHTPGPWTVSIWSIKSYVLTGRLVTIRDPRDVRIAEVGGFNAATENQDDANAALISLAPDMFDALRAVRAFAVPEELRPDTRWSVTGEAVRKVSAVLEKLEED